MPKNTSDQPSAKDVEIYVKGCDICLTAKTVYYKLHGDLQLLSVPTHRWKDFSIDFVIGLSVSIDWKNNSYNSILVIIYWLTKIVYYEPVKIIIDALYLIKVIIAIIVQYYDFFNLIISDQKFVFISKFWSLLYYFLDIKQRFSTALHS